MERKSKLIQGDSGEVETDAKGKETGTAVPALNALKNSKQPTGDHAQPQQVALALSGKNQHSSTATKKTNRLLRESNIAVDVNKNGESQNQLEPTNQDLVFIDAEKSLLVQQFDPFDKVLLTKGMDNQILTSFRTLEKSNNMISNTLKVIH